MRGRRNEVERGWDKVSSETQLFLSLPTRMRTLLLHSLVPGPHPHLSLITETCSWRTESLECSWIFFPALYIWVVVHCSGNIRLPQNKPALQERMEQRQRLPVSAANYEDTTVKQGISNICHNLIHFSAELQKHLDTRIRRIVFVYSTPFPLK